MKDRIGNGQASPSINNVDLWDEICPSSKAFLGPKFLGLVGCNIFLLNSVEERKRKNENICCALDIQEFGYRDLSAFVMGLSRNISFYDKVLLSGKIGRILTSTWYIRLVS